MRGVVIAAIVARHFPFPFHPLIAIVRSADAIELFFSFSGRQRLNRFLFLFVISHKFLRVG